MLHTPNVDINGKPWCGPTAAAAITGLPISRIHKMIRRVRSEHERKMCGRILNGGSVLDVNGRRMSVRGTYPSEIITIMKRAGYPVIGRWRGPMALRAFLEDRAHLGPCIVEITGHFIAVSRGMLCDTYTKTPVPWQQYPKLRRQARRAWYFQSRPASASTSTTTSTTPSSPEGP